MIDMHYVPTAAPLFPGGSLNGVNYGHRPDVAFGEGAFTVYMPENLKGTVASITDRRQRTSENAPRWATYLHIEGEVTGATKTKWLVDRSKFEIVVYLGSNATGDFNIRRNYDYRIDINIAGDLSTDTRIEHSGVGYTVEERLTPDGKFIWCGLDATPGVVINPYNNGSGQVSFKCVFEGEEALYGMRVSESTAFKTVRDTQAGTITVSGTIDAGKEKKIYFYYDGWSFTPENDRVRYTLTFTEPDGNVTEYKRELRFANRSVVCIEPQYGLSYDEKTAYVTTPDGCVEAPYNMAVIVYHAESELSLTIHPLPGYTFIGWYPGGPPYHTDDLISTSPTITIPVNHRYGSVVYARVQKI
jgi:hypothetical protein